MSKVSIFIPILDRQRLLQDTIYSVSLATPPIAP